MFLTDQAGELIPIINRLNNPGFIQMYAGTTTPGGWLFCDGSLLLQATYPQLFSVIGTAFNTGGEAPTEFRIPDFRSRSPIGVGTGSGLSAYTLGGRGGEETHVLTTAELATHTHLQNSHNHTQDAHGHSVTDPGHNHTQNSHNHTQDSHNHTQDSHNHTQDSHVHPIPQGTTAGAASNPGVSVNCSYTNAGPNDTSCNFNNTTTATNQAATATNQAATATNQAATATNQSNTTGVTVANTTATNQATTAVNQNEGSDTAHNTLHPYLAVHFMIKTDV